MHHEKGTLILLLPLLDTVQWHKSPAKKGDLFQKEQSQIELFID